MPVLKLRQRSNSGHGEKKMPFPTEFSLSFLDFCNIGSSTWYHLVALLVDMSKKIVSAPNKLDPLVGQLTASTTSRSEEEAAACYSTYLKYYRRRSSFELNAEERYCPPTPPCDLRRHYFTCKTCNF